MEWEATNILRGIPSEDKIVQSNFTGEEFHIVRAFNGATFRGDIFHGEDILVLSEKQSEITFEQVFSVGNKEQL